MFFILFGGFTRISFANPPGEVKRLPCSLLSTNNLPIILTIRTPTLTLAWLPRFHNIITIFMKKRVEIRLKSFVSISPNGFICLRPPLAPGAHLSQQLGHAEGTHIDPFFRPWQADECPVAEWRKDDQLGVRQG